MTSFSEKTLWTAYLYWLYRAFPYEEKEAQLEPFLHAEIKGYKAGQTWLRTAREASLISADQAASNLSVTKAAFCALEVREKAGTITLESLAKAAEAIDCELVYAIRPKKREKFSALIWQKLVGPASKHPLVQSRPERFQASAIGGFAIRYFRDPEFRRKQGWSFSRKPRPLRSKSSAL